MYGSYTSSIGHDLLFRRAKKHNRVLHQIDDNVIELDRLMTCDVSLPFDISLRSNGRSQDGRRACGGWLHLVAHWLAIDGKQPAIHENPIIDERRVSACSRRKFNRTVHLLSVVRSNETDRLHISIPCLCRNSRSTTGKSPRCASVPTNRNGR